MRSRSSLPFRAAPLRVDDPPSHDALLTAFLSSLSLDERSGSAVLFGAAARHFLHWMELHGIAIRTIDDRTVRRFEKHRCRCHRYSAQQPVYKADHCSAGQALRPLPGRSRLRRCRRRDGRSATVPRRLFRWDRIACNSRKDRPSPIDPRPSISRPGFALCGGGGPISTTRSSTSTARMFVAVRSGASEASSLHQVRSVDGGALGTSSSFCGGRVPSHQSNRWRMLTRTWRLTLPGFGNIAAPPKRRSAATGPTFVGSCPCWASLRNGMRPALRRAFERRSKETPGSVSLIVTIMRSYIRFLIGQGECRPALLHAIPSVQRYRLSTLPRHVCQRRDKNGPGTGLKWGQLV